MAKPVIMPRFGMTQEEATIVRWLCADGARVQQGDPICEVTTDKINMEVEAPADGILSGILYHEGDTVPVTKVIATILSEQERQAAARQESVRLEAVRQAAEGAASKPAAAEKDAPSPAPVTATPLAQRIAAAEGVALAGIPGSGTRGRVTSQDVKRAMNERAPAPGIPSALDIPAAPAGEAPVGKVSASPAARYLAKQYGVALGDVPGSGPEGRVQGWDVEGYQKQQDAAQVAARAAEREAARVAVQGAAQGAAQEAERVAATSDKAARTAPAVSEPPGVEVIPLEGMRKIIAERLQASYQQAPHIRLELDIDMGRVMALREALNPRQPAGRASISLTALIVRACALALREQPLLNSHFVDGQIWRFDAVHIGVAVALEAGLIVPVVHDADRLGLNALGDVVADLSQRAREGRLRPDDVAGGTFTISNLGMFAIDRFSAIINPPQVGILAVGRVARRFVPGENDQPVARSLMTVSLSADHRIIDGLVAARFLGALKERLENPNLMLV